MILEFCLIIWTFAIIIESVIDHKKARKKGIATPCSVRGSR